MKSIILLTALILVFPYSSFAQTSAYVTNMLSDNVVVLDTSTNMVVGSPIAVAGGPNQIAITPDGSRAYVTLQNTDQVSVIDTSTNMVVGSPINVGMLPEGIAVTPDGTRAYVVNDVSANVSVIDTNNNMVITTITVGMQPNDIAITPDGARAYVTNTGSSSVSVIDTASNTVIGSPITVGPLPEGIAITPDGSRAYVASFINDSVYVINTATNMTVGSPIPVGMQPTQIAISPDGTRAYVSNVGEGTVSVINTATNMTVGSPITVGNSPAGIAVTPDGTQVYVTNTATTTIYVIDTATNMVSTTIPSQGANPTGIAMVPAQPSPDLSLAPSSATNFFLTSHTVTATLADPLEGILIDFEVGLGPNRGESSSPGECTPNADCTTDSNGEVSWSYTGKARAGTDRIRSSLFDIAEQRTKFSNSVLATWVSPITLLPTNATTDISMGHTVTAKIENEGSGVLVNFLITSGPNRGLGSEVGDGKCAPNEDCTTDSNGEVSWTYDNGRRLGTDTIVSSFFVSEFETDIDSNSVFNTWVLPQRSIPTLSQWGLIATAGFLGLFSLLALRRRNTAV